MEPFPANRVSKTRSANKKRERSRSHSMRKLFLVAASISALTCAVAFAQTTPTPSTSSAPSAKMDQAASAASAQSDFVQLPNTDVLSSNVVGLDVYDANNSNNLGTIKDVAFDSSKRATAYIMSVGGVLGMGARYVAVNPDAVNISYDMNDKKWRANMNVTKEALNNRRRNSNMAASGAPAEADAQNDRRAEPYRGLRAVCVIREEDVPPADATQRIGGAPTSRPSSARAARPRNSAKSHPSGTASIQRRFKRGNSRQGARYGTRSREISTRRQANKR